MGTKAQCAQKCPAGASCTVLSPSYTSKPTWKNGDSLYCYTLLQNEVGPAKKSNPKELAILKYQKASSVGIFACDVSSVFSDTSLDIGGASTTAVTPTAEFRTIMRKDKPEKYLNTPLFMGAWKQIKAEGVYSSFSWTVKADIPTVFLPSLLKARLAEFPETPTGTYIETCNKVLMGYFGNLEVTSKTGMRRFLEQFESYYVNGGKCWKWDTEECKKKWQYGAWGEDLFMQFCMDDAEVAKKRRLYFDKHRHLPRNEAKVGQEKHGLRARLHEPGRVQICSCPSAEECVSMVSVLRCIFCTHLSSPSG